MHIVDLAIWNSFALYTKLGGTKSPLSYGMTLIREIFKTYHTPKLSSGRPSKTVSLLRLTARHFPVLLLQLERSQTQQDYVLFALGKLMSTARKFSVKAVTGVPNAKFAYVFVLALGFFLPGVNNYCLLHNF